MGLSESPIRVKSFQFACAIINYCDILKVNKDFELASQLLRSGTSIRTNTREAQQEVSAKKFNNKFGTAFKEANEAKHWLEILQTTEREVPDEMMNKCEEINKNFCFPNQKLITQSS